MGSIPPLPDTDITDEEIEDFLQHLVFAVNQPNEIELSEIITREIGEQFDLIDSSFVAIIYLPFFNAAGQQRAFMGRSNPELDLNSAVKAE